jgi:hypothetical protein
LLDKNVGCANNEERLKVFNMCFNEKSSLNEQKLINLSNSDVVQRIVKSYYKECEENHKSIEIARLLSLLVDSYTYSEAIKYLFTNSSNKPTSNLWTIARRYSSEYGPGSFPPTVNMSTRKRIRNNIFNDQLHHAGMNFIDGKIVKSVDLDDDDE